MNFVQFDLPFWIDYKGPTLREAHHVEVTCDRAGRIRNHRIGQLADRV